MLIDKVRDHASKLHKRVGEILTTSPLFRLYTLEQEYNVKKVHPDFHLNCFYDWVILELRVIIEVHGRQHYKPVDFGNDYEKALTGFHDTQRRDKLKEQAAKIAGWHYVIVTQDEVASLTDTKLLDMIEASIDLGNNTVYSKPKKPNKGSRHKEMLDRQKAYRQKRYLRLKELKNNAS